MTPGPGVARTSLPKGFFTSGINSGVRRYRPDLGVIVSEVPAAAAGVFTQNEFKAAPIQYSMSLLPSDQIRAIVTNSGQANAATGELGILNNQKMISSLAYHLGCQSHQVLSASTGTIGVQMEIGKILDAVPELVNRIGSTAEPFALAILTTDLVPKTVSVDVALSQGTIKITGIAKGSGMIHPNMATMLGYFLTDAKMPSSLASEFLKNANHVSFNMISVDGECSTNDCAFILANGASGVSISTDEDYRSFQKALTDVATFLAQCIARDGEGATKLIEVKLQGAEDEPLARRAARSLVISPLIKTAVHGEDPNWGRILARLGAEAVPVRLLNQMNLKLQGIEIFDRGSPLSVDLQQIRNELKSDSIRIEVDFKAGPYHATAWGCDLSKKYVEINAEYLT